MFPLYNQAMDCKQEIIQLLKDIVRALTDEDVEPKLEHPSEENHGDYSTNVAMQAFRNHAHLPEHPYHKTVPISFSNAREFAEKVVEKFFENKPPCVKKAEVAGPGFINFWLSEKVFEKELEIALFEGERYGSFEPGSGLSMVLDHSHPNIAKRFGIGHLRSTIIGQALVNIHRFLGWNVVAENFLGDWGTQFGSLLYQIINKNLEVDGLTIDDLEKLYIEFNKEAKENEELWDKARRWFKKLEDGDPQAREIWQKIRQKSLEEFERIWDLLGVKFDHIHGESFFIEEVKRVLEDADRKGFAEEDDGALIIRVPGFENPLILQKSDGATTYEIRDLAAIRYWANEFRPNIIAYEVGVEQALHFQQVFTVAEMLGYFPKINLVHIKHGLYLSPNGKKMRTRTGETVRLEDVLNEAIERAKKLGARYEVLGSISGEIGGNRKTEKTNAQSQVPSVSEGDKVARAVGIGAVKYFDLSHHPSSDILFDWEKIFQLEGNSAPYIQYTYARCRSVTEKAQEKWRVGDEKLDDDMRSEKSNVSHQSAKGTNPASHFALPASLNAEELACLRYFYRFNEILQASATNFSPNLLCNFLFGLSQRYNTFYNKHRILNSEFVGPEGHDKHRVLNTRHGVRSTSETKENPNDQSLPSASEFRLSLTEITGNILKTGLNLLGIHAPERM